MYSDDEFTRGSDIDMEEQEEQAIYLSATQREYDSALACSLPSSRMSSMEKECFPMFADGHEQLYISIRNVICVCWQANIHEYLPKKKALEDLQNRFHTAAGSIYDFLEQYGHINSGIIQMPTKNLEQRKKKIVVIGAGASGLAAANQLRKFGHEVLVIEGRGRLGGRVKTDTKVFSGAVDLGASIINGLTGNPVTNLCRQVAGRDGKLSDLLRTIGDRCLIFGPDGKELDSELDRKVENDFNKLLASTDMLRGSRGESKNMTQEEEESLKPLEDDEKTKLNVLDCMRMAEDKIGLTLTDEERAVMQWHESNLEYGCAQSLQKLSLEHWDQDDPYGFEGEHVLLRQGYNSVIDHLAKDLNIKFNSTVYKIDYNNDKVTVFTKQTNYASSTYCPKSSCSTASLHSSENYPRERPNEDANRSLNDHETLDKNDVTIEGEQEEQFEADAVLVTVPLGVLKHGAIEFSPALPSWKQDAINSLGFGILNKLVLEFPTVFWENNKGLLEDDTFGYVNKELKNKGRFYMFWNLHLANNKPVLTSLIAGAASYEFEKESAEESLNGCMEVLRKIFGVENVPDPVHYHCTRWANDQFARGSYSYVAVGATGDTYDRLRDPIGNKIHFAGEATNRHNPATVPGAYISGLLAAGRIENIDKEWLDPFRDYRPPKVLISQEKEQKQRVRTTSSDSKWNTLIEQAPSEFLERWRLKKKRGLRTMFGHSKYTQSHVDGLLAEQQKRERLERMMQLSRAHSELLNGTLDEKHLSQKIHISKEFNIVSADIKSLSSFTAKSHDFGSLPEITMLSSEESEFSEEEPETKKKDHKNRDKKKEKRRLSKKDSAKGSSRKKQKTVEKGEHHKQITKYIRNVLSSLRTDAVDKEQYKTIAKKATDKVYDDWTSKERGSLKLSTWFNDSRKAKISQMIQTYVDRV